MKVRGAIVVAGETVACSTDTRRTRCSGHKRDLRDPSPALLDGCNGLMTRSLNDPHQGSLPHLHEVQTVTSVTIRLLILTPGQRVNRIRAETDVLQR
jgi:hypothetical protein